MATTATCSPAKETNQYAHQGTLVIELTPTTNSFIMLLHAISEERRRPCLYWTGKDKFSWVTNPCCCQEDYFSGTKSNLLRVPKGFGMLFAPLMSSHHRPSISNLYSYLPGASSTVTLQNPSSSFFIGYSWVSQLLKSPATITSFAVGALTLKVTLLFPVCPAGTLI